MQKENSETKSKVASPNSTENKGQEEKLSPLKPQQLYFGSTFYISQGETTQNPLLPSYSTPPPLPTPIVLQLFYTITCTVTSTSSYDG